MELETERKELIGGKRMNKVLLKKEYIVKEGQADWRVWSRANDYIFKLMREKRKSAFKERMLKKSITVKIEVIEEKN